MSSGGDLIHAMESYLGVHEVPAGSNRTRVGDEFGWNGVAWCCETVSNAAKKIGFDWYHTASCLQAQAWAKQGYHGLRYLPVSQAQPGDIFIFKGGHHTGVVAWLEGNGFVSVEGNWGDACQRVTRRDWSAIDGVIRLPFTSSPTTMPPLPPAPAPAGRPIQQGDKGTWVSILQMRLNNLRGVLAYGGQSNWEELAVDGDFGPATARALSAFQLKFGAGWDAGKFGAFTGQKLNQVEAFVGIKY